MRAHSLLDSALRQRTLYDDALPNNIDGRVSASMPTLSSRYLPYVPVPPPPQPRRLPCFLEFIMCMISHEKYRDELRRSAPKGQFVNSVSQIDKVSSIKCFSVEVLSRTRSLAENWRTEKLSEHPATRKSFLSQVSRVLFPVSFFFLNILYWLGYGHYKPPGWQDHFNPVVFNLTQIPPTPVPV